MAAAQSDALFSLVTPFFKAPPRRAHTYTRHAGTDYARRVSLSYFAGPSTWAAFQEKVTQDHQAMGSSDPGYAWLLKEGWSMISRETPPPGWVAFEAPDLEFDSDDHSIYGGLDECIVIRDPATSQIVGFVAYTLKLFFDDAFTPPCKPLRKKYHEVLFQVYVDLIYVLPSYRGKSYGSAMRAELSNRVTQFLQHALNTSVQGRRVRLSDITVYGDCDSDEGCLWLQCLHTDLFYWLRHERKAPGRSTSLRGAKLIDDFDF